MTVRINKPAINLREKLAELDKPSGLTGEELLRSQTSEEARNSLDLEEHLFENFESTGIDDNATSTKVTVSDSGVDVTGTVTADGLTVDGDAIAQSTSSSTTFEIKSGQEYATTGESKLVLRALNSASGTSYSTSEIVSVSSGGGDNDLFLRTTTDPSGAQNRIKIDSDGDISFYEDTGTTAKFVWDSSAETLTIGASSGNTNALRVVQSLDGTSSRGLSVEATTGHEFGIYRDANSDGAAHLRNNGIDTVSLKGGNVGIGTASPSQNLHINGQAENVHLMLTNSTTGSTSNDGFHLITETGTGNAYIIQRENANLITYTNNTERARIDSSGKFMLGTTSGAGRFNLYQAGANWAQTINHANGTQFFIDLQQNGSQVGSITGNGTNASYNTTSDERLKENIQDTTHNVDINDIRVREFDWKANGEHQRFGFIAQELEVVYPEAVHSPENPEEMKAVDYSKLVPLLVKEIQTLKARIETLENN